MHYLFSILLATTLSVSAFASQWPIHAHNDYEKALPLYKALQLDFKSIEVDIINFKNQLYVAHDFWDIEAGKTLTTMYLTPLYELWQRGELEKRDELILLVDVKSNADQTYNLLIERLRPFQEMLSERIGQTIIKRSIRIIISGNRSEKILSSNQSFLFYDGRINELNSDIPASVMPLVSDNWANFFRFNGSGNLSSEDSQKLASLIHQVHQQGKIIRFWNSPDNEFTWGTLIKYQADLINTDSYDPIYDYFSSRFEPSDF